MYIKVADYGISTQITPQGIRGIQGTRPYLPPEMILCGGREPYSTKVDVYAFGMFIYYLTSFRTPFDNIGRPITSVLDEGKRPELSLKVSQSNLIICKYIHSWEMMLLESSIFQTVLQYWGANPFNHYSCGLPKMHFLGIPLQL